MKRNVFEITKNVAIWEFNRFFKWMDLIKGILFFGFFAVVGGVIGTWAGSQAVKTPTVAISDFGPFSQEGFTDGAIRFRDMTTIPVDSINTLFQAGDLDGILTIKNTNEASIRLSSDRAWLLILEQQLNEIRTEYKLSEFSLELEVYETITAPVALQRVFEKGSESSIADKIVAGVAILLLLMAVFMGFAYQFTAITAEKQQRMTEQVLSAITPQTWIDGKILGITGIGLVYVLFYGAIGVFFLLGLAYFGVPVQETLALINPVLLVTFILMALVGTLMWNAFLAGVAATIDDPNTSAKTGFMMLPMFPISLSFITLLNPDTIAMQILGIFPLTSYAVLPARMVLTHVAWWEPVAAIILLIATAWLLRIIAGRIFAAGMMMYGKEPDWMDMFRLMVKRS